MVNQLIGFSACYRFLSDIGFYKILQTAFYAGNSKYEWVLKLPTKHLLTIEIRKSYF